ncbi:putative nuclease HARBI1 [Dreissena polymorpha]|nr:putative nuclease HARBI1 [Dreissena polymorpha]
MAVREYRERIDIAQLTNDDLYKRYRVNHATLAYIIAQLDAALAPNTDRSHSLSTGYKVLITLRYLATGVIQLNTGDLHSVAQSSVSRAVSQTLDALSSQNVVRRHIRFPTTIESLNRNKQGFFHIARFPNVIGVIDGTHVQIQAPSIDEPMYVNRMGYHSINTQIVFDHNDMIMDVVARWPGSTHDSRILRGSGLWQVFDRNLLPQNDHFLLGDSGYPCKRWLLTPYVRPANNAQEA